MGISEGYKRIAEKQKADWLTFLDRCHQAGMPPPDRSDFDGIWPKSRHGWGILENLLTAENCLNDEERQKIRKGLELISIRERVEDIRRRLEQGADLPDPQWPETAPHIPAAVALRSQAAGVLRWVAIKELGLDKSGSYDVYAQTAMLEMYRIAKERGDF
jgi:hypothetical protein